MRLDMRFNEIILQVSLPSPELQTCSLLLPHVLLINSAVHNEASVFRQGNWSSEWLSDLLRITQLLEGT